MIRYKQISREEFDAFTSKYKFHEIKMSNTQEVVYQRISTQNPNARFLIYSSVLIHEGITRNNGKDSIKLILQVKHTPYDSWISVKKFKRVYRTKSWETKLHELLHDACKFIYREPCYLCGSICIKRKSKYGTFYSCALYRETGCEGKY